MGRDSRLRARSLGGEGGAAGVSCFKCPGLKHPSDTCPSLSLRPQVRAVQGRGGPGPGRLELRPRCRRGPRGRGGLEWARRSGGPGERPRAWAPGGRLRPGSLRNPCAASFSHLLIVGLRGSFGVGRPRSLTRTSCRLLPAAPESKAAVQHLRPETGLREGRLGARGPGTRGFGHGCSAKPGGWGSGGRGGQGASERRREGWPPPSGR